MPAVISISFGNVAQLSEVTLSPCPIPFLGVPRPGDAHGKGRHEVRSSQGPPSTALGRIELPPFAPQTAASPAERCAAGLRGSRRFAAPRLQRLPPEGFPLRPLKLRVQSSREVFSRGPLANSLQAGAVQINSEVHIRRPGECDRSDRARTGKPNNVGHLQDRIVGHILRDSMAIEAREKPVNTKREVAQEGKEPRKRGRPRKGESKANKKANRLAPQARQKASVALSALNTLCCWGCKRNSQGNVSFWKGYKLHLDVTDMGIPVTAVVTGANVHDSQLAIPTEKLTERKVKHLYTLMDAD